MLIYVTNWEENFNWLTDSGKQKLNNVIANVLNTHIPDKNYVYRLGARDWSHSTESMLYIGDKFVKKYDQNPMDIYNKTIPDLTDIKEIENKNAPATIIWVTQTELITVLNSLPWAWIKCSSSQLINNFRTIYTLVIDVENANSLLYVAPWSEKWYYHCDLFDTEEFKSFKIDRNIEYKHMHLIFEMNKYTNNDFINLSNNSFYNSDKPIEKLTIEYKSRLVNEKQKNDLEYQSITNLYGLIVEFTKYYDIDTCIQLLLLLENREKQ